VLTIAIQIGEGAAALPRRVGRFLLNTALESVSAPIVVWVNWLRTLAR
jgi:hypothetical protein